MCQLTFFNSDQTFLCSRPSICSSKCHLLSQRNFSKFRVGPPSRYRRSQRPAVQLVVSKVLWGRRALRGLRILPWRLKWRQGSWRDECWGWRRRGGGADRHCGSSIHPSSVRLDGALGDSAEPGGPYQLLLPHPGHKRSDAPEQ